MAKRKTENCYNFASRICKPFDNDNQCLNDSNNSICMHNIFYNRKAA